MSNECKHSESDHKIFEKISSSLDRFQEAHFWLHGMEKSYHLADPFRWHFNAFLRSLKEVPQLILMDIQADKEVRKWYQDKRKILSSDPLLKTLFEKRDFVVHQAMLLPESSGQIGITKLRGMKLGMGCEIHPLEDSDTAIEKYLHAVKGEIDILGILSEDEDTIPCVFREWKIKEFDEELIEVSSKAWLALSQTFKELLKLYGVEVPLHSLDCRHSKQQLQYKLYDRSALRKMMEDM